jgi:TPR repeat protein
VTYDAEGRVATAAAWPPDKGVEEVLSEAASRWVTRQARRAELIQRAEAGDVQAAISAANQYENLAPLTRLAQRGSLIASTELAVAHHDWGPFNRQLAKPPVIDAELSPDRAFSFYKKLKREARKGTAKVAWTFLCYAADKGHGDAQVAVGEWHRESYRRFQTGWPQDWISDIAIREDLRVSYVWYSRAAEGGVKYIHRGYARRRQSEVEELLRPDALEEAREMARAWAPGQCAELAQGL